MDRLECFEVWAAERPTPGRPQRLVRRDWRRHLSIARSASAWRSPRTSQPAAPAVRPSLQVLSTAAKRQFPATRAARPNPAP